MCSMTRTATSPACAKDRCKDRPGDGMTTKLVHDTNNNNNAEAERIALQVLELTMRESDIDALTGLAMALGTRIAFSAGPTLHTRKVAKLINEMTAGLKEYVRLEHIRLLEIHNAAMAEKDA